MHKLAFKFQESKESNDHEIRPIIDDVDILNLFPDTPLGIDPPEFFAQTSLLNGGEALIGRCSCGVIGCGSQPVDVEFKKNSVIWILSKDKKYEFEKTNYCLAIAEAAKNTAWESIQRTAERCVSTLDFSSALKAGYRFQWASARIKPAYIVLSFEHQGQQTMFDVSWNNEDPENARAQVQHFIHSMKSK